MSTVKNSALLGVAVLLPLAVYAVTLEPTVFWLDSGIFLSTVKTFGIAFPPGFPLYILLAKAWSTIALKDFAWRINFLSAVLGALSSGSAFVTLQNLLSDSDHPRAGVAALAGSLFFAFSPLQWSQSLNAEVYGLQVFLTAAMFWILSKASRNWGGLEWNDHAGPSGKRLLLALAVVSGLGYANHPVAIGLLPSLLCLLLVNRRALAKERPGFMAAWLGIFLLSGFIPYLYIPLRSLMEPPLDFGSPKTLARFIAHVTARQWTAGEASKVGIFAPHFPTNLRRTWELSLLQWGVPGLLLAAWGALHLLRNKPTFFALLASGLAGTLVTAASYRTGEVENWISPAFLLLGVATGAGIFKALELLKGNALRYAGFPAAAALVLFPLLNNYPSLNRSRNYYAEDYGRNLLKNLPTGSLLLLEGDAPLSSATFVQETLGERRDVLIVQKEAFHDDWYLDRLKKRAPASVAIPDWPCASRGLLRQGDVLECSGRRAREFAAANSESSPVFEILPDPVPGRRLVPAGILYRITQDPRLEPDPGHWDFSFHDDGFHQPVDIVDGCNDAMATAINGYVSAHKNLADWLMAKRRHDEASGRYDQALRLIRAGSKYKKQEDPMIEARLLNGSAVAHSESGRYAAALERIDEAMRLAPLEIALRVNRGVILAKSGDVEGARRTYRDLLRLGDNGAAKRLLDRLPSRPSR